MNVCRAVYMMQGQSATFFKTTDGKGVRQETVVVCSVSDYHPAAKTGVDQAVFRADCLI
jgi:hypothetical protein